MVVVNSRSFAKHNSEAASGADLNIIHHELVNDKGLKQTHHCV
jgi:hypothetical protein